MGLPPIALALMSFAVPLERRARHHGRARAWRPTSGRRSTAATSCGCCAASGTMAVASVAALIFVAVAFGQLGSPKAIGLGRRDPGALRRAGADRLAAGGVARHRALGQSADRRWRAARWPASPASPPCRSCPTCSRSTSTGTIWCRRWASCSCSSSARSPWPWRSRAPSTPTNLLGGIAAIAPTFLGVWLGQKARHAVSPETFRRIFLFGMFVRRPAHGAQLAVESAAHAPPHPQSHDLRHPRAVAALLDRRQPRAVDHRHPRAAPARPRRLSPGSTTS